MQDKKIIAVYIEELQVPALFRYLEKYAKCKFILKYVF